MNVNHVGQPVGEPLVGWTPPPWPPDDVLEGSFCRVERLNADTHARDLFEANAMDETGANWTYLPYGPFSDLADYEIWLADQAQTADPQFHAIVDARTGRAVGVAAYLRIDPDHGVIEGGHINYSPALQRTAAGTEAMYLMMRRVFELGYRRYEWKSDALNGPSRTAADRLGFKFEGIFRQATMYKGRNRDTSWYSVIDCEWPALDRSFRAWLDPANFRDGVQLRRLGQEDGSAPQP